eukprot:352476-Chlamydomonas_euryale.AAC.30
MSAVRELARTEARHSTVPRVDHPLGHSVDLVLFHTLTLSTLFTHSMASSSDITSHRPSLCGKRQARGAVSEARRRTAPHAIGGHVQVTAAQGQIGKGGGPTQQGPPTA